MPYKPNFPNLSLLNVSFINLELLWDHSCLPTRPLPVPAPPEFHVIILHQGARILVILLLGQTQSLNMSSNTTACPCFCLVSWETNSTDKFLFSGYCWNASLVYYCSGETKIFLKTHIASSEGWSPDLEGLLSLPKESMSQSPKLWKWVCGRNRKDVGFLGQSWGPWETERGSWIVTG